MFSPRLLAAFRAPTSALLRHPAAPRTSQPILTHFRPQIQIRNATYYRRPSNYRYNRFQQASNLFTRWAQRDTFYYEIGGMGVLVGGFYVANLETVPVSGRRRFNVISPAQEAKVAGGMYEQVLAEYRGKILSEWDPRSRMVQRVLDRLIPASGLTDQKWEVHVIDEPGEKNAFVIPGGKVFVFTGILDVCKGEDGLATVLGHEIAHNVAHHSAEKISKSVILWGAYTVAAVFFGLPDISRLFVDLVLLRPGSRTQESEADYIGLMMMAQCCYNPEAAVALWGRMEAEEKYAPPQFISTHPSSHNRQERIREWLPEAQQKRADGDCHSTLDYADDFRRQFGQLKW